MTEKDMEKIIRTIGERFPLSLVADRLGRRDRLPIIHALMGAIRLGEFTLASGARSNFYIDARTVTMNPAVMPRLGAAIFDHARLIQANAIGGPATAAIPMATAAALMSEGRGAPFAKSFYVRAEPKQHGTKGLIEGLVPGPDDRVLLVDDVLTSGGSIIKAATAVRETGARIVGALVIVDRQEGGVQKLEAEMIETHALYKKSELLPLKEAFDEIAKEMNR